MNKQALIDLISGFNNDVVIRIEGWVQNPRAESGFSYETVTLGSQHLKAEKTLDESATILTFGSDL